MSSKVSKSYYDTDPVKDYCIQHSTPLHPVQRKLIEETLKHKRVSCELCEAPDHLTAPVPDDGGPGDHLPQRTPDQEPRGQEGD